MRVADVLGVHGIGQQQSGRNQMLPDWQAALRDGIERARGRGGSAPTMDLAYYGDLFLAGGDGKKGFAVPDPTEDLDDDTVRFLEDVQNEVVDPEEPLAPETPTKGLPRSVTRLGAWLERRFGIAGKLLFYGDLIQVRRYQRDDGLADSVVDRLRDPLGSGPRVLVGHSLGSIVAYEALCVVPDHGVKTLVTLGSPLGLRSIRAALHPEPAGRIPHLPPGVHRWVNVYDEKDPVSLAGGLSEYWSDVDDETVDNGSESHAVLRYLGKKVTGEAVAGALT